MVLILNQTDILKETKAHQPDTSEGTFLFSLLLYVSIFYFRFVITVHDLLRTYNRKVNSLTQ